MKALSRPVVRFHGGKFRIAPWIVSHFPAHRIYVEPFGGAASVLLRKPRSYAEVYNDLDGEVVNVFRVLRDLRASTELERLLRLTPFARVEFEEAYHVGADAPAVERARATIAKAFMGFGSGSIHDTQPRGMRTSASSWRPPTGFRANSWRSGTTPATDWSRYPGEVRGFYERLQGVVIENRPALEVMRQHDRPDTLHYLDPPYPISTRNVRRSAGIYQHEMTDADHGALLEAAAGLAGMVILSGYRCPMYDDALSGWRRVERAAIADRAAKRTEVLWINPAAAAALEPVGVFAAGGA